MTETSVGMRFDTFPKRDSVIAQIEDALWYVVLARPAATQFVSHPAVVYPPPDPH